MIYLKKYNILCGLNGPDRTEKQILVKKLEKKRKLRDGIMKTIDLCCGIGGIRRGFELAGDFENVLSA